MFLMFSAAVIDPSNSRINCVATGAVFIMLSNRSFNAGASAALIARLDAWALPAIKSKFSDTRFRSSDCWEVIASSEFKALKPPVNLFISAPLSANKG